MDATPRRVWLEISLGKLTANYRKIANSVKPANVICVLKANAYGLGVLPIARALADAGVETFGVAEPHEAVQLLPLGRKVQILSSILPDEIEPMIDSGVTIPITDLPNAKRISKAAKKLGKTAIAHIKLDTGMGRLGIRAEEAPQTIRAVASLPNIELEGIFSHFPYAYADGSDFTNRQISLFKEILAQAKRDGVTFAIRHIAASDAINNFPAACRSPFNYVRTGINLHGSFDPNGKRTLDVQPVLSLKTRIAQVRTLPAGATIGYGLTYRVARKMRVGAISAGYADGLPLALSNRGHVLVHGIPCPILGRISMDYTTVSLESVPEAKVGDEVVCIGGEGPNAIAVEDWGALKMTHAYDIICSFGNRVERRYVK